MEIKSRVTRLAGLLCVASALQGFPVISSTNPGGIISVTQQGTYHLTGTIVDEYGEPVIGANIVEKGTTNGTVTDIDGKFSLEVAPDAVLTISFIGYIPKEITLKGEKELKVVLMEDTQTLDEVVVVGYGTQKKVNLTGAVEQVTSEVFDNRSVPNVTQALQGSIPNLNIQLTDGKPTRSASYNVRGTTSIGQGGSALVLIDGVEGDPSMLNPNDIASVSVLKDAASAAIYGARGTFGVVLITTKEPTKDKTSITYSGNFAMQKPVTVPDFVTDGYEYASHFYEAYHAWNNYSADPKNINKTQEFSLGWLEDFKNRKEQGITDEVTVDATGKYVYYGNEDYYDALYKKTTFAQDHNLSVTGNNGKLNYYVSGRFYGYDGLFRYNTDDYKMMNLRAKGSVQVFDWLKIENNMDFSNMDYHNPINVGEGGSIWRNISDEGHPTSPIFNPDGSLTFSAAYSVGDFIYGKNGIDTNNKVLKNTTGFTASFLENKLHVRGDFTFRNTDEGQTQRRVPVPYSTYEGQTVELSTKYNDLKESNMRTEYIATNLYADYEETFGDAHYFKGMIGYNYEQSTYKSTYVQRNGLLLDDSENINLALGDAITTSGGYNRWRVAGGFFRLNYAFKDRYLLEVNGRYDGSSKFPTDQQWAFFPSVSGGWRVSEEAFWKVNPELFSNLKIRASYGSLGNGNVSPYSFLELLSISTSDRVLNGLKNKYTSAPAVMPDGLTWETATTTDVGLDFGMLNNRLQFNGDYYIRKTTDMYTVGKTLPDVFGASSPKGNYADMTTKGWEITLTWRDQFTLAEKPFNYEIRGTLSDYISTIDRYNNQTGNLNDYYAGKRVGEIWGYVTEGLFKDQADIDSHADQTLIQSSSQRVTYPGDVKIKDLNGDHVIDYGNNTLKDHGDKTVIGNTLPRYAYSINLSGDWNNFFLSAFFQGVGKQDWYPSSECIFWGQYNRPYNNMPTWHQGNYWTEDNTDAYLPRYAGYNASLKSTPQTRYLQNVAYIRLKNLQFGYTLPQPIISKAKLQNVRVYISAENLWCWSPLYKHTRDLDVTNIYGSDPDLTDADMSSGLNGNRGSGDGNSYPQMKSVSLGLSVTF
ncbi:SusC/RagA family TonB-linked outer membrane protein [Parabacteroides johnsonii]|uniref:SusC/RagA family TonB-linked outer membrane protein n=1 Tax=Parabacteroides johnsonii TaxID=387661 RepID=UPI00242BBFC6|nr:TonB-dependent receptor [Parabacteroides johnsonii]